MKKQEYEPITCARILSLANELAALEELLRTFEKYIVNVSSITPSLFPKSSFETELCIVRQQIWCSQNKRGILASLDECKEWDAFPDEFWNGHDPQFGCPALAERDICFLNKEFPDALNYVIQEIERISEIADNCLRDYQYSDYIDHQPVAIDFMDYLIEICEQLQETRAQLYVVCSYTAQ